MIWNLEIFCQGLGLRKILPICVCPPVGSPPPMAVRFRGDLSRNVREKNDLELRNFPDFFFFKIWNFQVVCQDLGLTWKFFLSIPPNT